MKTKSAVSLTLLVLFALANAAYAEKPDIRLSAGIGYLQGDTTYQIGGEYTTTYPEEPSGNYDRFPISELSWPLNVVMGSIDLTASYWRLSGAVSYRINLSEPKQKMEDSDWGYLYYISGGEISSPDLLDTYSESSPTLDAKIFDANLNFEFLKYKGWGMQIGVGYMWQDFSFVASNLHQWYPPFPSIPDQYESGRVITYDVTYRIPYAQLLLNFHTKKIKGALSYQFSPLVNAKDEDNHLLIPKIMKGDSDGYMNAGRFYFNYDFTNHFFSGMDFYYRQIKTKGSQKQHIFAREDIPEGWIEIDNEIVSEQIESKVSVGYRF